MKFSAHGPLRGEITVPGDKSIAHRSIFLGAAANGVTRVFDFPENADCLSSISCLRALGVKIDIASDGSLTIHGGGPDALQPPAGPLDAGDSGTTARFLAGLLAARPFDAVITGDALLKKRPMKRIIDPLSQMGASIRCTEQPGCLPLRICSLPANQKLRGIDYTMPVASAQVKSSLLLAGLSAESPTAIREPAPSRDHTERMLLAMDADLDLRGNTVTLYPGKPLKALSITLPGDISSAAYFIAAALIVPGSSIRIRNVGLNPTRDGLIRVLRRMGGRIALSALREESGEPAGDIAVSWSSLHGTEIQGTEIPSLIDELPVLAVACAVAEGPSVIRGAAELRVKETDRIAAMTRLLTDMGADITSTPDGWHIAGGSRLHGARVDSMGDHRIAMSCAVAALAASGETILEHSECVRVSYPAFYDDLGKLLQTSL